MTHSSLPIEIWSRVFMRCDVEAARALAVASSTTSAAFSITIGQWAASFRPSLLVATAACGHICRLKMLLSSSKYHIYWLNRALLAAAEHVSKRQEHLRHFHCPLMLPECLESGLTSKCVLGAPDTSPAHLNLRVDEMSKARAPLMK